MLELGLAVWALAYLLVYEDGPWHILEKFRKKVGVYYDIIVVPQHADVKVRKAKSLFGELLNCPVCLATWLSLPMTVLWLVCPYLMYPLAAIGLVIVLSGVFSGDS